MGCVYQFMVDSWIVDTVQTKENPVCCHIDSYSLLNVESMLSVLLTGLVCEWLLFGFPDKGYSHGNIVTLNSL